MISFYAILFAVAFLLLFKMPSYIKNKKSVELKAMNRDSTMTLRGAAINWYCASSLLTVF